MNLTTKKNTHQLLVLIISALISIVVFGLFGSLLVYLFLDINTFNENFNQETLSAATQILIFRILQPINTLATFLVPSIVTLLIFRKEFSLKSTSKKYILPSIVGATILIMVVKPLVAFLSNFNRSIDLSAMGEIGESLIETSKMLSEKIALVTKSNTTEELILNIIIIALIPAIAEEFFFRGIIQQIIIRNTKSYHFAIWTTALIFGSIHLNITSIIPLTFLGAILGYIFYFSENIWIAILAHFINNANMLLFVHKYGSEIINAESPSIEIAPVFISLAMTVAVMYFMYTIRLFRHSKQEATK